MKNTKNIINKQSIKTIKTNLILVTITYIWYISNIIMIDWICSIIKWYNSIITYILYINSNVKWYNSICSIIKWYNSIITYILYINSNIKWYNSICSIININWFIYIVYKWSSNWLSLIHVYINTNIIN
eukprot:985114_1